MHIASIMTWNNCRNAKLHFSDDVLAAVDVVFAQTPYEGDEEATTATAMKTLH